MVNCWVHFLRFYLETSKTQPLFGYHKRKIGSIKSFLGFVNGLLKDWSANFNLQP